MKYFWKATLAIRRVLHVAASHARFPSRYRALHFIGPCVTVFGSARIKPDDPHYKLALKMGAAIARLGFTVMTGGGQGGYGGGPTAAQKRSAAARFGCNVQLPFEESSNICLDRCVRLHYFFVRKALLIKYSYAFAVMLSGVGTLDELFEALALIRTRRSNIFRCDHRNRLLAATDRFH